MIQGPLNIRYTRLIPRRLNLRVELCRNSSALMHFILTAVYFLGQSVLASQVKKHTIRRRRSRRLSLYGFLDQKYNTVCYLNDPWYLARCERMRHKQVSRCAQSNPRASQQPRHYNKRAVFASPGSRVTKPPTEILTLRVKCRQDGESVGHMRFVTRHLVRVVRGLNRFSQGMCKTFCCRLRLKCDGTRADTRFRLSAKRTSPFKSAGASVQFSLKSATAIC